tara:strand:+ start:1337 stop:1672 length:336 start_codon:yes stop_codon:yes gene_type:complete
MDKQRKNELIDKMDEILVCPDCGPFVRVMVELWESNGNEPFALEFINQRVGKIKIVYSIKLCEPKEPCMIIRYFKCGHCNYLIGSPKNIPQELIDDAMMVIGDIEPKKIKS